MLSSALRLHGRGVLHRASLAAPLRAAVKPPNVAARRTLCSSTSGGPKRPVLSATPPPRKPPATAGAAANNGKGTAKAAAEARAAAYAPKGQGHGQSSLAGLKVVGGIVGLTGAMGGLMYYWALEEDEALKKTLEDPAVALDPPPAEFVHPYSDKPWWWKVLFAIKRAIYVAYVFLPVVGVGAASAYLFPASASWREYFLEALLHAMERAGCCFMKLGQWISMRPDMFPRDVVRTMARLRDGVPAHKYAFTRRTIREAFGKEIEEVFEAFDTEPIASGTVAQVYRARLRPEYAIHGHIQDVAVKVRHPNILEETFLDLDLIFGFVDSCFPSKYSMPCSQDELSHILRQQLDLKWEAYNLYKFSTNFRHELQGGLIHFPQVSKELCSDAVLVESWVEGSTIASVFSDIERGAEDSTWASARALSDNFSEAVMARKKQLAKILFDMNVKMFLRDNYVHGDMHAGNLIVSTEDGRVTVIDAGLITSLKPDVANSFGDFLRALCSSDVDTIVDKILLFNVGKQEVDREAFRAKVEEITSQFKARAAEAEREKEGEGEKQPAAATDQQPPQPQQQLQRHESHPPSQLQRRQTAGAGPHGQREDRYALGDVVGEILLNLQRFKIVLRGDVAASIMTISVSEGLILQLDPEFDMVRSALPFFVKYKGWRSAQAALLGKDG